MCFSDQNLNDITFFQPHGRNEAGDIPASGIDSLHREFMSGDYPAIRIVMFKRAHHRQQLEMIATDRNRFAV